MDLTRPSLSDDKMARSRGSSAMVFDEKCGMVMVGAGNRILYLELFKHGVDFWILSYFKAFPSHLDLKADC